MLSVVCATGVWTMQHACRVAKPLQKSQAPAEESVRQSMQPEAADLWQRQGLIVVCRAADEALSLHHLGSSAAGLARLCLLCRCGRWP